MKGIIIKDLTLRRVRRILDFLGITALYERIDQFEKRFPKSEEELWQRSRKRWSESRPTDALTWGRKITGHNFISKVSSFGVFSCEKIVLEIGPGSGRLLKACLEQRIPFKKYIGVDISLENVKYLRQSFPRANVYFIHGDVEKVSFGERFDVVLSSLTFKHLFPSFEKALRNVVDYVNPDGLFFFDLLEGKKKYFSSTYTYVSQYTRSEILRILSKVSLELVAFNQVQHNQDYPRLLVVAKKPK